MTLNGKPCACPTVSLLDYLKEEGYKPEQVVVEVNLEIFSCKDFSTLFLSETDEVNILQFMGGG